MGSLGETLKREREARGISLEEIAEQTKIGARLLKAIEAEKFDQLPGGIFNKSFVRQYARYLGLDEEKTVREYLRVIGAAPETPVPAKTPLPETKALAPAAGYLRIVLTAIFLGVLAVGVFYAIYRFQERLTSSSPPAATVPTPSASVPSETSAASPEEALPTAAPPATTNMAETHSTPFSGSSTAPPPPNQPNTAPALGATVEAKPTAEEGVSRTGSEGLVLRIDSRNPVWLSVAADGKKQWQGTLQPNQTRQVKAAESVRLTVGDAGAVDLTLNGKPLPPVGRSGEVKTIIITAQGLPEPAP